ncbi:MAG: hypothetical protein WCL51_13605 [Bacteroidota bacterium]
MRYLRKKETCHAWKDKKCNHKKKCTFTCRDYHPYINGINEPKDYQNIIHNKHSRSLATLSIMISFLALIVASTTTTVTIVNTSNQKVVKVSNNLIDYVKNIF